MIITSAVNISLINCPLSEREGSNETPLPPKTEEKTDIAFHRENGVELFSSKAHRGIMCQDAARQHNFEKH